MGRLGPGEKKAHLSAARSCAWWAREVRSACNLPTINLQRQPRLPCWQASTGRAGPLSNGRPRKRRPRPRRRASKLGPKRPRPRPVSLSGGRRRPPARTGSENRRANVCGECARVEARPRSIRPRSIRPRMMLSFGFRPRGPGGSTMALSDTPAPDDLARFYQAPRRPGGGKCLSCTIRAQCRRRRKGVDCPECGYYDPRHGSGRLAAVVTALDPVPADIRAAAD